MNTDSTDMHATAGGAGAGLSRRTFLRLSGMAALGTAGAGVLAGCGPSTETDDKGAGQSSSAAGFGEDGTMRVGMEVAYPPYNFQVSEESDNTIPVEGQDGAYADGYDIVFAKRIGEALGLTPVAVKMEFSGLVEGLTNGTIDIICGGMTATDERRQSIDFSDPYWDGHYGLLVKKGSPTSMPRALPTSRAPRCSGSATRCWMT